MDSTSEKLLAQIVRNIRLASLGTLRDNTPFVSMIAFVPANDFSAFYIQVSRLAQHTTDMQKDKHVSLMIAEVDDGRADPLTLARVSIRGIAELMPPGEPGYTPIKSMYLERFPDSESLFELGDFEMWRILPKGGRYIAGLAKSYNITPESLTKASRQ